jgi:hypothetical protein
VQPTGPHLIWTIRGPIPVYELVNGMAVAEAQDMARARRQLHADSYCRSAKTMPVTRRYW